MTNTEFCHLQDQVLQLTGRDLAEKLRRSPSDIARWRKDVEIPGYIEELLGHIVREKLGTLTIPLTIADINGIIRLAAARGHSFEGLLVSLIRKAIATEPPANVTKLDYSTLTDTPGPSARVADDTP